MFIRSNLTMFCLMTMDKSPEMAVYFLANSNPFGISFGRWTVEWWRWYLSTPCSYNLVDCGFGKLASDNNVWFLVGKAGNEYTNVPTRFCKIPASHSILFPVINCEVNALECPQLSTDRELTEYVDIDQESINKRCLVDEKEMVAQRIKSDPVGFEVNINRDNPYGVQGGGKTIAAADGYWVFLKPLSMGMHHVFFQASCEKGRLNTGADYQLLVE
jgi:hypothetical protein